MIWLNAIICKAFLWLTAIISRMAHCHYAGRMETEKTPRVPQAADKYILRLPDGMRDKISELAKGNNRSMNAEIVSMLQQAMEERASGSGIAPSIDIDALARALAPKLAEELRQETAQRNEAT